MGQKTHPLGFRLCLTQNHRSVWYTNFTEYSKLLAEDYQIRTYLDRFVKAANISNIQINRNGIGNQIQLNLETGRPGVLIGKNGLGIKNLLINIKKILPENRLITINVIEVEKINLNSAIIGDLVVKQLEERIAFKRAMREALKSAYESNIKGIKIQVSGRLNGAEIARSEWIREGRVPLQTLNANIDYAAKKAHTIYGILGIKVWLFKNKILLN